MVMRFNAQNRRLLLILLLFGLLPLLSLRMDLLERWFLAAFPELDNPIYDRAPFAKLMWEHFLLVAISSGLATAIGVVCGIFVTRPAGREFLSVVNSIAALGQTFPPVAVLALAVPIVGFGFKPTVIALFIYGLMPIVRNTIAGLESVPKQVIEAAKGMGMSPVQILSKVELPLALKVIVSGIRTSTIINIGTATLGATIGAGGLGAPIIAGLISENQAYVLQGALLVGLFAISVDLTLEYLEHRFSASES